MFILNDAILFTKLVGKLLVYADEQGIDVVGGEWQRDAERQAYLVKTGASQRLRSRHQDLCALDLDIFKDGMKLTRGDHPLYKKLGDYWESLDERCVWGADWDRDDNLAEHSLIDGRHFELKAREVA